MGDSKNHDYLDIGTPSLKSQARTPGSLLGPLVVLGASLACIWGLYELINRSLGRPKVVLQSENGFEANADDINKRQVSAFVERFLPAYYNYSYTLYDQSVEKAESMMTPAFQAAYNQRAEDIDFKRKLTTLRVSTDGIKILPGSMAFSNDGARFYVRLAGTMTFTTGINGVSGDFPLTLLLAIEKTESGFLADNVERLR